MTEASAAARPDNDHCEYLRQIHPCFLRDDLPTSAAFQPTKKDEGKLSGCDGDQVTPEQSFVHYTEKMGLQSVAVFGVTQAECLTKTLPIIPSPRDEKPHHVHLDFNTLGSRKARENAAKHLRDAANSRGALYRPAS